jgi:hypothetical protein
MNPKTWFSIGEAVLTVFLVGIECQPIRTELSTGPISTSVHYVYNVPQNMLSYWWSWAYRLLCWDGMPGHLDRAFCWPNQYKCTGCIQCTPKYVFLLVELSLPSSLLGWNASPSGQSFLLAQSVQVYRMYTMYPKICFPIGGANLTVFPAGYNVPQNMFSYWWSWTYRLLCWDGMPAHLDRVFY